MGDLTHASLFSGIGGFDLAAERTGFKNLFACEIDPFCQRVLRKNFGKDIEIYGDIRQTSFIQWRGRVHVLSAGFPCQPFSQAGKRAGRGDDRFLWGELLRAVQEINPPWLVLENVVGITNIESGDTFEEICNDLEIAGYEVQPFVIPAYTVGAPHRRNRIWITACNTSYTTGQGFQEPEAERKQNGIYDAERNNLESPGNPANPEGCGCRGRGKFAGHTDHTHLHRCEKVHVQPEGDGEEIRPETGRESGGAVRRDYVEHDGWERHWYEAAAGLCGMDARIPGGMDRIRALGNSIVPQIAEMIFEGIREI